MLSNLIYFFQILTLLFPFLFFLVLILSHFSVYAEGVKLSCIPNSSACANCSEYQTLFPIEELSSNTESLDIEADNSEILSDKYLLNGNVEVNSDKLLSTGYKPKKSVEIAIQEMIIKFKSGEILDSPQSSTVQWMKSQNLHE